MQPNPSWSSPGFQSGWYAPDFYKIGSGVITVASKNRRAPQQSIERKTHPSVQCARLKCSEVATSAQYPTAPEACDAGEPGALGRQKTVLDS